MLDESIPVADQERIKRFVAAFMARLGSNPAVRPPQDMIVGSIDVGGWADWQPVDSPLTGRDMKQVEDRIGHPLPALFRAFFQYKCLLRTDLCYPVRLPAIRSDRPLAELESAIRTYESNRFFHQHCLFPFGNDSTDIGPVCFALNRPTQENDYPVIQIDVTRLQNPSYAGSQRWPSFDVLVAEIEADMLSQR